MRFLVKNRGKSRHNPGESGVAIILLVISLVFFLIFFLIFIDVAYVYYIRGQLQNAADSGALAGAAKLKPGDCLVDQSDAIGEATAFALKNTAAGELVVLEDPSVDPTDIIFGNWDSDTRIFTPCGDVSVNAIKVNAKKTENRLTSDFGLVFGKIFNMTSMKIGAVAIAETGGGVATLPLPLCLPTVEGRNTDFSDASCPGEKYILNPPDPELACGAAWVNLDDPLQQPSVSALRDYFDNPRHINLCEPLSCMRTKQGLGTPILSDLQTVAANNAADAIGTNGNPIVRSPGGETVQGWRVLIPILDPTEDCNGNPIGPKPCPGDQPQPYKVIAMADAIVTKVDTPPKDDCPTCGGKELGITFIGPVPVSTNVTTFRVLHCDNPDDVKEIDALGGRPRLVQ